MNRIIVSIGVVVTLAVFSEVTFGMKWITQEALIQDVWPNDGLSVKLKRESSGSDSLNEKQISSKAIIDDDDDGLVFDGHYFKPNEVPPPPGFMVAIANRNWHGKTRPPLTKQKPPVFHAKVPALPKQQLSSTHGPEQIFPAPQPQKFLADNAKQNDKNTTTTEADSEQISSNSRNVLIPSPISLDEKHYHEEELVAFDMAFRDAPKCFTPTDIPGRCIPFQNCFPIVFNVIDGNLRNPGLAKLLYQSSGPCSNASLEVEFALNNSLKDFLNAKFYNQTICCPGFKHPPTLIKALSQSNDVRNARLISPVSAKDEDYIGNGTTTENPNTLELEYETVHPVDHDSEGNFVVTKSFSNGTSDTLFQNTIPPPLDPPLKENESSVEGYEGHNNEEYNHEIGDDRNASVEFEELEIDAEEVDDFTEREQLDLREADIHRETPYIITNGNYTRDHNIEFGDGRRGDRDKYIDPYLAVNQPNVAPDNCHHQLYGMPRGHWPWMVAIVLSSRHICSGSLIDEITILTASHCLSLLKEDEIRKLRIIIGDRVMYSSVDGPHFWRKVSRIITHVNYNQQTFASDIAILKMNSAVPFSRNVQPISLPDGSHFKSTNFRKAIVSGWSGANIGQPAFEPRTEIETVVDIMDKSECREMYRGFAVSGLATNTFCTKPSNNTCVSDSGGPLVLRVHNCYRIFGIMSWGIGCHHFPEVFTDVSRYTSWIKNNLK